LQEVFLGLNTRKQKLVKYATKAGFFDIILPHKPGLLSRSMIDSGLIILSRFPIVDSDELVFKSYFDVDALSAKGAVFAKI